jgi:hypothetical protein
MLLQKISLFKLSELKRHGCPDTPLYAKVLQNDIEIGRLKSVKTVTLLLLLSF